MPPSSTSPSTDSVIKAPRRRFVADDNEKAGPSSRHNGLAETNGVVTLETPDDEEPIRFFVFSITSFPSYLFLINLEFISIKEEEESP